MPVLSLASSLGRLCSSVLALISGIGTHSSSPPGGRRVLVFSEESGVHFLGSLSTEGDKRIKTLPFSPADAPCEKIRKPWLNLKAELWKYQEEAIIPRV